MDEQQLPTTDRSARWEFRLYVAGRTAKSLAAIDNLKQVKDRMQGLVKQGLVSESNVRNIDIVDGNLKMYATEIAEIKKGRAATKLADLMGNLGSSANDVMAEYRANYAGQDRRTRDLDLLSKLCDQLGELARQMSDLGRAEVNEMNLRNLGITTDNLVMLENEWGAIAKLQGVLE